MSPEAPNPSLPTIYKKDSPNRAVFFVYMMRIYLADTAAKEAQITPKYAQICPEMPHKEDFLWDMINTFISKLTHGGKVINIDS